MNIAIKKFFCVLFAAVLCIGLVACGPASDTGTTTTTGDDTVTTTTVEGITTTTGEDVTTTTGEDGTTVTGEDGTTTKDPVTTTQKPGPDTKDTTATKNPTTTVTGKPNTTTSTTKDTTVTTAPQGSVEYLDVAPAGLNSAQVYGGLKGQSDAQADVMRNKVINYPDTLKNKSGKKYYVSQKNGSDLNDGTSPETAWQTLSMVNSIPQSGDIVLFERGGAYRGQLTAKSGVSYGAYGTGVKPAIYNSKQNYATAKWVADPKRENVYYYQGNLEDVGVVVINHGAIKSIRQKSAGGLTARAAADGWYAVDGNRIYVVSKNGNPSEVYNSIEIGEDQVIIGVGNCKNTTFENLAVKYTGGHGMQGANTENLIVRGCEFGWIGGSILGNGTTPYGNAIEWWGNCKDNTVEDCWIYQCYDTGWTFQHSGGPAVATGQKFINNLVEYCWYSTETWVHGTADEVAAGKTKIENIEISGNIMRFAGYCFGANFRPDKVNASHHFASSNTSNAVNYVVKNNIFEGSYQILLGWSQNMVFDGNTYIQTKGNPLTYSNLKFDDNAEKTIKETMGDKDAKVSYNSNTWK